MKANMRYAPTKNGYSINASSDFYNRALYGSHKNDDKTERFFTFAGDTPIFLGALTDYVEELWGRYAKCGALISGLALTPGHRTRFYYSEDIDLTSRWFHKSQDVSAEFKNGWMEYELTQISSWFPDVKVNIEAYPLLPDDGFLVRYKVTTDQRVIFTAGFGGVTGALGRFEYPDEPLRNLSVNDCKDNTVEIGDNRASVAHPCGTTMRIAASFPAKFELGSAKALSEPFASTFLGSTPENNEDSAVKISAVIEPGQTFDGYLVVTRNTDEATLDRWLSMPDPIKYIKAQIVAKHSCIALSTPDNYLDLTVAPTVIALDASWHKDSFHHGAFAYHAPFLGWRNWYAPTALGWQDRVKKTIEAHLKNLPKGPVEDERIWDRKTTTDPEKRGSTPYTVIENSPGRLPSFLDTRYSEVYNMQECAFDMMLYYIEWTGDLALAEKYFDDFCLMLDWEERVLDPDGDGLYQNYLNTWISDGHSYNGAGCAQSCAYNYRANIAMVKIAKKLGKSDAKFLARAEKIRKAVNEKLWLANEGVIAESLDTVGKCLVHPAPELSTIYLAIDCDLVDEFKAYMTLRYAENEIKSIVTAGGEGRLYFSSNWLPKQYSNCGIFPAENAHLALVYYKLGLRKKAKEILDGIVDCYFAGRTPGMAAHIQSAKCVADLGDSDFTDVSSTYLRLIVEGLYGIRINALDDSVIIAPSFPDDWEEASLSLKDIALNYTKQGNMQIFDVTCEKAEKKCFRIPMVSTEIDAVLVDGEPIDYSITPAINGCFLNVEVDKAGRFQLRVLHGGEKVGTLRFADVVLAGNETVFEVVGARIVAVCDISEVLEDVSTVNNKVYARAKNIGGHHTLFVRAVVDEYDAWFAADYEIAVKEEEKEILPEKPFKTVDISALFNCNMSAFHDDVYVSPRPTSYSLGTRLDGRHCWNWNHAGHNKVYIDDTALRNAGGTVYTASGIPFATPAEGENLACVSVWDNFPTEITVPVSGKAQEVAVMFISCTNPMQTRVENARITVVYADGTEEAAKLVYPFGIDDWLTPALVTEGEIFYFNDYNHATVRRIAVDASRELAGVKIEAVANEVILGVIGVSISK